MTLTEEQKLALELLTEEAAEVIHIKAKIIRFGLHDNYKKLNKGTNKERLEEEIGHFKAAVQELVDLKMISPRNVEKKMMEKEVDWMEKENVAKC